MRGAADIVKMIGNGKGRDIRPRPDFAPRPLPPDAPIGDRWKSVLARVPSRFRAHRLPLVAGLVARGAAVAEARAALEALVRGELLVVTLVGRSEAGKTSLVGALVALLCELADAGDARAGVLARGLLWTDELALSRARASHKLGDGEAPLVERAVAAPLVVLDDLGQPTAGGQDEVIEVIWRRHQEERPLILTTGQPREKLTPRYGDGIYRRIARDRSARVIRCAEAKPKAEEGGAA